METPNLKVRRKGDLLIVDINTTFNQTDGRRAFHETIGRLSEGRGCRILVNLAGITDANQTGLRDFLLEYGTGGGSRHVPGSEYFLG
jgi:hypothetical protein